MTREQFLGALQDAKQKLYLSDPETSKAIGEILDWGKAQLPESLKDIHIAGHVSAEPVDLGTCRSCKADIGWVLTPKGEKQPVDAGVVRAGILDPEGKRIVAVVAGYQSHFVTCPDRDKWSGSTRKRSAKPDNRSEGE